MKEKSYVLNTALAAVLSTALLICLILKICIPGVILPPLNIPNMAVLSLIALLLEHYLAKGRQRFYPLMAGFSALTFGLLPVAAGVVALSEVWRLALVGAALFCAITFLFTAIQERLSTTPKAKAAPILSAIGLYLASQCFVGMIL